MSVKLQQIAYEYANSSNITRMIGDDVFTKEEAAAIISRLGNITNGFHPNAFIPDFALKTSIKHPEFSDGIAKFIKDRFSEKLKYTTLSGRMNFVILDDSFHGSSIIFFVSKCLDENEIGIACFYPSKFDEEARFTPISIKDIHLTDTHDKVIVGVDWHGDIISVDLGILYSDEQ